MTIPNPTTPSESPPDPPSAIEAPSKKHGQRHTENFVGPLVSLGLHATFLLVAAILVIRPPIRAGEEGPGTDIDLAGLSNLDISDMPDMGFDAADPAIESSMEMADLAAEMLEADLNVTEMSLSDVSTVETLGGAGEDVDASGAALGGGGGGGTSFFGVSSRGRFFMYIVDTSGSMGAQDRLEILKENLRSSINALPEHTSFFIFAYNDRAIPLNGQAKWRQANRVQKLNALAWINALADGGATVPEDAFDRAFDFNPIPDVIYFMTDGEDISGLAELVADLNDRGKKAKIHCIGFGNSGSERMMKRIAEESGGRYRFVPVDN